VDPGAGLDATAKRFIPSLVAKRVTIWFVFIGHKQYLHEAEINYMFSYLIETFYVTKYIIH